MLSSHPQCGCNCADHGSTAIPFLNHVTRITAALYLPIVGQIQRLDVPTTYALSLEYWLTSLAPSTLALWLCRISSDWDHPPRAAVRADFCPVPSCPSRMGGTAWRGGYSRVDRHKEIEQRLAQGRTLREIARALKCSRRTVREVRDGLRSSPEISKAPLWMSHVDWPQIVHDLGLGHPLKFLWEERARDLTSYSNFWKHYLRGILIYRRLADLLIFDSFGLPLVHIKRTRSRRPECQKMRCAHASSVN